MPERRLRALFVSNWLSGGGAERFVSNALHELDPGRFELSLCLFRRVLGYPVPESVPISVLSEAPVFRPWQLPGLIRGLAREIDRRRPDVVVSAYSYPSAVVGSALWLAQERPRWVARVASNPVWHEAGLRRPVMRLLYRRADLVLANSQGLADVFARVYPFARDRIALQTNPTDFGRLDELAREPVEPAPEGRARLVAVGRLRAEKRVDLLLEALARVRKGRDLELVLCGDGPLRGALEQRAAQLGLADCVRFAGFERNPFAWMASADLFVLTSDTEGSPNALIEAQGLGVAAVATDCPFGPSEIVEPGVTGWLVPVGDVTALAAAIDDALSDPQRTQRMGSAARARVRGIFAAERAGAELAAHLERVAGRA